VVYPAIYDKSISFDSSLALHFRIYVWKFIDHLKAPIINTSKFNIFFSVKFTHEITQPSATFRIK